MQNDVSRDFEFVTVVIAGSVHNKQDQLLGIFLRQGVEEDLEALRQQLRMLGVELA